MTEWFLALSGLLGLWAAAAPSGDLANGRAVFTQCAACHSMDPAAETLGPTLRGVVGRKAGAVESYVYSPPMRRSEVVWTPAVLDAFLVDPQSVVRGTKMPFSGLPTAKDRQDLIAYLSSVDGAPAEGR